VQGQGDEEVEVRADLRGGRCTEGGVRRHRARLVCERHIKKVRVAWSSRSANRTSRFSGLDSRDFFVAAFEMRKVSRSEIFGRDGAMTPASTQSFPNTITSSSPLLGDLIL
jgi:hypothetical protein